MTRNLTKAVGAGVLSLSMALPFALRANAQVTDPRVETTPRTTVVQERRDFDWGWLGLIGLFGLAGLAGRKHGADTTTGYRDPTTTGSTTYRD